jgi:hypothetical protein
VVKQLSDEKAIRYIVLRMPQKPSAAIDNRVISCGDNLDQVRRPPDDR